MKDAVMTEPSDAPENAGTDSSDLLWRSRLSVAVPVLAVVPALAVFAAVLVASLGLRTALGDGLARQARLVVEMAAPGHEAVLARRMEDALRARQPGVQVFVRALPIAEAGAVDDPMPAALQRALMDLSAGDEKNAAVLEGMAASATSCGLARSASGAAGAAICTPAAALLAPAEQLVLHGFAVLVAVAGLAYLTAMVWLRRLTRPLARWVGAVRALAAGDTAPTPPLGAREWADWDRDLEVLRVIVARDEERQAEHSRAARVAAPQDLGEKPVATESSPSVSPMFKFRRS